MARAIKKSGSRKRFAEGGTSDRYQAKYDRKVADIESDYQKAMARKTGRAAEVAKAKYDQRMADAKDDLAKWRGSDRTETRAAERAAERNLSLTRRVGARAPLNIESAPSLDKYIKPVDVDTKSLIKNATPTAPAPSTPRVRRVKPPSGPTLTPMSRTQLELRRTATRSQQNIRDERAKNQADFRRRMQDKRSGNGGASSPRGQIPGWKMISDWWGGQMDELRKASAPARARDEKMKAERLAREEKAKMERRRELGIREPTNKKEGGTVKKMAKGGATKAGKAMVKKSADTMGRAMVKKYAKGGSVNGIAIRGKTRAPMKKGK